MPEAIMDQERLLKLAYELNIDLNSLMEKIRLDPVKLHEGSRSQFIKRFFYFLEDAIGFAAIGSYISNGVGQDTAPTTKLLYPPPILTSRLNTRSRGGCIIISGIPREVTSSLLLQQIHGGPLESILRRAPKWDQNNSFIRFSVNFLAPEAAEAFMTFANSPAGRLYFPGANNITLSWCTRGDSHMLNVVKAAWDPSNPARRVIIFGRCPLGIANKAQMAYRLQLLDKRFGSGEYCVDSYEIAPDKAKIRLIFNCIGAAVSTMKLYKERRLGVGFENCKVVYGADPVDHPIPAYNASRTVILYDYFGGEGGKSRLNHRLLILERKFHTVYSIKEYQINPLESKARIVFNCVQAAMKFREYHSRKVLGAEFDGCEFVAGSDSHLITEFGTQTHKLPSGSLAQVTPKNLISTPSTPLVAHTLKALPAGSAASPAAMDVIPHSKLVATAPATSLPKLSCSSVGTLVLAPSIKADKLDTTLSIPVVQATDKETQLLPSAHPPTTNLPEKAGTLTHNPTGPSATRLAPEMFGFEGLLFNKHE